MESFKNILLVAATEAEISPIFNHFKQPIYANNLIKEFYLSQNINLDILITGVGSPFTVFKIMKIFSRIKYDLVLNVGFGGSFDKSMPIGTVLNVVSEHFADLGIEHENIEHGLSTLFEKGFMDPDHGPFTKGVLLNPQRTKYPEIEKLRKVNGITVNTAHIRPESINWLKEKFSPDIESMEGAAVFYTCLLERTEFYEIRVVSNYVTNNEDAAWDKNTATEELSKFLINLLEEIKLTDIN